MPRSGLNKKVKDAFDNFRQALILEAITESIEPYFVKPSNEDINLEISMRIQTPVTNYLASLQRAFSDDVTVFEIHLLQAAHNFGPSMTTSLQSSEHKLLYTIRFDALRNDIVELKEMDTVSAFKFILSRTFPEDAFSRLYVLGKWLEKSISRQYQFKKSLAFDLYRNDLAYPFIHEYEQGVVLPQPDVDRALHIIKNIPFKPENAGLENERITFLPIYPGDISNHGKMEFARFEKEIRLLLDDPDTDFNNITLPSFPNIL